jgi:hypothetical protein
MERNMIDVAITNGCPDMTPADLLEEQATAEDLIKLEQVMGRFTSTTAFLSAFKKVLVGLEAGAEVEALDKFIPIMAHVEASAMNDSPGAMYVEEVSEKERILRVIWSPD